jgi:hypothetical protein
MEWILLGSRATVIAPGPWLYVSITFLLGCAWSESSLWCQCSSSPKATRQWHWCVPKAISWRTSIAVAERRCTCVGWVQTRGIWSMGVVVCKKLSKIVSTRWYTHVAPWFLTQVRALWKREEASILTNTRGFKDAKRNRKIIPLHTLLLVEKNIGKKVQKVQRLGYVNPLTLT